MFAGKPVLAEFWDEIGVNWGQVARGANATMWSTLVGYGEHARARLEAFLDQTYAAFVAGVSRGRGLSRDEVLRSPRGGSGPGSRPRTWGWSMSSAASIARSRWPRRRSGSAPQQTVELRQFPEALTPWEEALELLNGSPGLIQAVGAWLQLLRPGVLSTPPIAIR